MIIKDVVVQVEDNILVCRVYSGDSEFASAVIWGGEPDASHVVMALRSFADAIERLETAVEDAA